MHCDCGQQTRESRNLPFFFQVLCKRDYAAEAEVQSWIESVLGQKFPEGKTYEDVLKDGVILCRQAQLSVYN